MLDLRRHTLRLAGILLALALLLPAGASAQNGGASTTDAQFKKPGKAKLKRSGKAVPPADAPPEVVAVIRAANKIAHKPYRYGGGHGSWRDSGYDCSGSVSYALHGGGLLDSPLPSSGFYSWGERGKGKWITVYTQSGHMFAVIAGLRFDTGYTGRGRVGKKVSRWSKKKRPTRGYKKRHYPGL